MWREEALSPSASATPGETGRCLWLASAWAADVSTSYHPHEPLTAATHMRGALTFGPSAPTRPSPPCWGDSPQGSAGSLAEECVPSPSKGRCTPHEVCGVLEHARAPAHPELLIRTERAKLVRAMRRERPAGVGKVCGVLPGDSSLIARTGALPSPRGSHTAPRL